MDAMDHRSLGLTLAAAMLCAGCLESSTGSSGGGCEYDGESYEAGDRFPSTDGCNTCACDSDGSVSCTLIGCGVPGQCQYGGVTYDAGDSFPSADGCNTCACDGDGSVSCTLIGCGVPGQCQYDGVTYDAGDSFADGDGCNTCECESDGRVSCTRRDCMGSGGGGGGDPTCELPFDVGPCDAAFPVWWFNAASGQCEQRIYGGCDGNGNNFALFEDCVLACGHDSEGTACRVGGQTYPHGAGVPDPYSCNGCSCDQGQITGCTEADCPEPCADGTKPGTSCAACGPADGCEILETDCLPACDSDDDCAPDRPYCNTRDGHCALICG